MGKVRKVWEIYRRYGLKGFFNKLSEKLQAPYRDYDAHRQEYLPAAEELEAQKKTQAAFPFRPLISIVVPLYETKPLFLEELLDSVRLQSYPKWELILADASRTDRTEEALHTYQKTYPGFGTGEGAVRYRRLAENGGISLNTNEAIKDATGDLVAFMDHDDVLTENALFEVVATLNRCKDDRTVSDQNTGHASISGEGNDAAGSTNAKADNRCYRMFYTDEDKADESLSHFSQPHFKKDFDLELLRTNNYICHLLVLDRALLQEIGGLRPEYDGSQDYDLTLRAVEALVFPNGHYDPAGRDLICHIPKICYHWRMHAASTAGDSASKKYTAGAGQRAVEAHFARLGIDAKVEERIEVGCYRITYPPVSSLPSALSAPEAVSASSASGAPESADLEIRLDDTLKPRDPSWKEKLIATCMQEGVAAVYGKIYGRDGRVVEAGVEKAPDGTLIPQFAGLPGTFKGYERRAVLKQETSACDASFAVIRPALLDQPGARIIFDPDVEADVM